MNQVLILFLCLNRVENRFLLLIVNIDFFDGLFRQLRVFGRNCGDGFTMMADLLPGQERPLGEPDGQQELLDAADKVLERAGI